MGKKKAKGGLGKALIKDRFGPNVMQQGDSYLHTSELGDGLDWNRINLKSVTEENTLDEFLATAELAGTEFVAEKLNVSIINPDSHSGLLSAAEERKVKETQDENKELLRIPRRPYWDETTTSEELDQKERDSFLEWRRSLAGLQEIEGLLLTPFERNLDFWRQLWRVIERSDIVVQIVDARNPLLYRSEDLEKYVKEVSVSKQNVILINKADFLTEKQRKYWANYFDGLNIKVVFWSAVLENERCQEMEKENADGLETDDIDDDDDSEPDDADEWVTDSEDEEEEDAPLKPENSNRTDISEPGSSKLSDEAGKDNPKSVQLIKDNNKNDTKIVNGDELVDFFKSFHTGRTYMEGVTTIGLVGYPNVGKSSTINAILQAKKVPVSSTPGRTKHFQTLFVEKNLLLCDCPGLVMPSFVTTKAAMVVSGILPIDQMRDYIPPVSLLMPRKLLEAIYGIILPAPAEGENPNRPPTPHELLGCYATMRGYMTHKGVPDFQRAARLILKDFVNGKLLYREAPPSITTEQYKPTPEVSLSLGAIGGQDKNAISTETVPVRKLRVLVPKSSMSEVDKNFFESKQVQSGVKGKKMTSTQVGSDTSSMGSQQSLSGKPWKKHNNKHKKEKLRRMNKHMDT